MIVIRDQLLENSCFHCLSNKRIRYRLIFQVLRGATMLYDNAMIITVDEERRIFEKGALVVKDDRIIAIGDSNKIRNQYQHETDVIDLQENVLMPGLVNTHVHLSQALIRGCCDDQALVRWLVDNVWMLIGNYSTDDARLSAELCILEMLKSGVTSFVESMIGGHYSFDGIAKTVEKSGIRAALGKIIMDVPAYTESENKMHPSLIEDPQASFEGALAMHERWNGKADGRIEVWFGPRPPGGCSPDLYRKMMSTANEKGMRITVHLAESRDDITFIHDNYGLSAVKFAQSVNMLGSNVLLIHAIWLEKDEITILADTGTHVTHNPLSNSKLASGIALVPELLDAGVNVGLGTDGGPSSNDYDMIRAMRWASYLHKVRLLDPEVMPNETVIEMATINGAQAMGWKDEVGSLEVGKKADFIVIDMKKPHLTPSPNPLSSIVCNMTGKDVQMVVIDGKLIVQDGKVLTLDESRIIAEANERAEHLYKKAGIDPKPAWPII
jgi:cytosine/adenosine deaminase-related metal-dependent hydrolase